VDLNPAMLAVAERVAPDLTWLQSPAEKLPLPDGAFDAVVSQFGLMFFQAREAALREMARVLRPGGRLAVAVWDAVERTDGYPELTELLRERVGEEAAHALRAPFVLGDRAELAALFEKAGMGEARIVTRQGAMRFPDLDAWIFTEIRGWVLADRLTDAQYAPLLEEARTRLARFVRRDGTVELASPAHLVTFTKPE
jgi:SAM-dependent methyltransferase